MEQRNCITKQRGYKHFNERERYRLEGYLEAGISVREIADKLNKHKATIYRERKRGLVVKIRHDLEEYERYRANVGQRYYRDKVCNRKRSLKISKDKKLREHIREKILEALWSPDAILGEIKRKGIEFKGMICVKTLYNYVEQGIFQGVSNESLWEKRKRKKKRYREIARVSLRNKGSRSIEERDEKITKRLEYGHWEGDCVKGKRNNKTGLFTLTERKTREQIIFKIVSLSQESIIGAMNKLEIRYNRHFRDKFRSITLDNGGEFLDWKGIENSVIPGKKRTLVYFAHPYSSWERGSNENQNRMIRRFIPKGTDISKISEEEVKEIEDWMNNYPRKILGYRTAREMVLEITKNRFESLN